MTFFIERSMDFLAFHRTSFYPGILYREVFLFIGRFLFLGLVIMVALFSKDDILSARVGIISYALALVTNWFVAKSMIGKYTEVKPQ